MLYVPAYALFHRLHALVQPVRPKPDGGPRALGHRGLRILQTLLVAAAAAIAIATPPAHAARLKDLAAIEGVRSNQLIGYGLVVGLDGSGDQTQQSPFTTQSLQSMLQQLGVNVQGGNGQVQLKNVAAVMVTAQLGAFALPGQTIDVTVSSMGNAKSLRGGTLLMTPLKGADGNVYALAQGSVVVGGAGASSGASKTQVNHLSAGRVPAGATVERAVDAGFSGGLTVRFMLHNADFTLARRVAEAINAEMHETVAQATDARVIEVRAPPTPNTRVTFLARLENVAVDAPGAAARVIINARSGSVVMNQAVILEACAVAHGNLTVTIANNSAAVQPAPFSLGTTATQRQTDIQIKQDGGEGMIALPGAANLADVVKALNLLGASPQDLIAILQAMQASGSLRAELEII